MFVSVFTPSHRPRYLDQCYQSLVDQTHGDWEWVLLLNGSAGDWRPRVADERVRVIRERKLRGVGAAKRAACQAAKGEVLVELDHDDLLAPTCLQDVVTAFATRPNVVLVYSDWTQVNEDLTPNHDRFDEGAGWTYDDIDLSGRHYLRCHALQPSPHNVGYIWYAPNHVRAFRRDAYEQAGGYDASLRVLDDQDLMHRLYLVGEFHHVSECLYLQRVHSRNTQIEPKTNAFIQAQTVANYQAHIRELTSAWARRQHLREVTLRVAGSVEAVPNPVGELEIDPGKPSLSLAESSVGAIHAAEVLQHIPDRAAFFNECYRVLVHAGLVFTETPSTDGRGAFQDPSHVAYWNENSFWYLTQAPLRHSLPTLTGRLQVSHLRTCYPSAWHEEVEIPYVQANLMAVKGGPRQGGPLLC
jgi:glycosyltransferase involved in cell wall biosynthesis